MYKRMRQSSIAYFVTEFAFRNFIHEFFFDQLKN